MFWRALLVLMFLFPSMAYCQSKTTIYKDKHGNTVGRSISTPQGEKYYDKHGNLTGSSKTQGKTTVYYDKHGNTIGKKEEKVK